MCEKNRKHGLHRTNKCGSPIMIVVDVTCTQKDVDIKIDYRTPSCHLLYNSV